ncbi:MAG: AraC family transcriptional regulator [Hyphomicrobiales bacterium]|nr:AraC family transcriptional regulator [Hyphomicrobiales bacterium]MCP5000513.1 AraC family transcriptional regulator [Hyphomicrobiales bacterium]
MNDALSDIFQRLRLKSCVYFQRDFHAPWGMSMDQGSFAQFHLIVSGYCVVEVDGNSHHASNGDVLLFPRGYPHKLLDKAGSPAMAGADVMASFSTPSPAFDEGGKAVRLVCGHYEYRDTSPVMMINQLPGFIHVKAFDLSSPTASDSVVPLLIREMDSNKPGSGSIVEHLAEILLIQTLREYARGVPQSAGLLMGLADAQLGKALKLIHLKPEAPLTVEQLAREAGMSRSAFSDRFKSVIGLSPKEYLTKMRLLTAGDLLNGGGYPIPQIAEKVGYNSEISFARAFKREMGMTPSKYRRGQKSGMTGV